MTSSVKELSASGQGTGGEEKPRGVDRVLSWIERAGNALPNPVVLFTALFAVVAVVSTALALADVSVTVPGTDDTQQITGLLTGEGVRWLVENLVTNFAAFPPIAAVLLMIMAVGVAEKAASLRPRCGPPWPARHAPSCRTWWRWSPVRRT